MNNVLSRVPFSSSNRPYLIWWPTRAEESAYRQLAHLEPKMLPQIIRASVHADYKTLFDKLLPQMIPDEILIFEAGQQGDLHYRQAIADRIESLGITPKPVSSADSWKLLISREYGRSTTFVGPELDERSIGQDFYSTYDGRQCDAASVELMACLPDNWKVADDDERGFRYLDYKNWPPGENRAVGAKKSPASPTAGEGPPWSPVGSFASSDTTYSPYGSFTFSPAGSSTSGASRILTLPSGSDSTDSG
jgi:hypothetical protein